MMDVCLDTWTKQHLKKKTGMFHIETPILWGTWGGKATSLAFVCDRCPGGHIDIGCDDGGLGTAGRLYTPTLLSLQGTQVKAFPSLDTQHWHIGPRPLQQRWASGSG